MTDTFPARVIESAFSLLLPGRYLLPRVTLNRYIYPIVVDLNKIYFSYFIWGVLVLLTCVQILVRLDCVSDSITMEV